MTVFQITAFATVTAILVVFLKKTHPEIAVLLAACAGAILLVSIIKTVYSPVQRFSELINEYGIDNRLLSYLLKTLGICCLTRFSVELCTDFGQTSLGNKIDLAGRAAVFVLTVPLIESVLKLAVSLM